MGAEEAPALADWAALREASPVAVAVELQVEEVAAAGQVEQEAMLVGWS